jgi:hypothetical protein
MPPKNDMRDWDKEMAKVDQAMAREGSASAPVGARSSVPTPAPPQVAPGAGVYTWLRLSLALVLGVGMTQWPYVHGCGFPLVAYLGGVVTVIVASLWSLISSWRSRSVVAHFISVGLLFWGAALAARELLPRIGYARQSATWLCSVPVQQAPAVQPAPAPAVPAPTPDPATPTPVP